ncbi:amino acid adenylation domain-containing protein [Lachnospira multipara]|uniref:Amino acid adenylation domain-containing protein n=1 Tax=Lachnospira multipara TaxID=28051 RepID=A0A1H5TPW9_9FIRM|nr:amino acid adenylation domain-containing protein [Lachnospira multipara]SEF64131.1 amino acid adenylation domain-containing protein [Lachnospira multipara]
MNTIIEKFMAQVNENKDALAVFDNERNLSRKELLLLADTIAARLPKGCKRVGIMMNHSVEMIASIFAALRVGAAYIPVEPFFPKERIRYMMEEAEVSVLITNREYADRFPELTNIIVDKGFAIDENAKVSADYNEKELAYILYTSGTTGKPKGVSVTNANVCHYVRAFCNEFHPAYGDIMLQHSVCSFDIFVEEVFTTLLSGAALAIPSDEERADVKKLIGFIKRNNVTMLSGFPYLLQEINDLPEIPKSLRLLISGGDVIRASYVTNLLGKVEVYNTYGPSETTVCASYCRCTKDNVLEDGTFPVGKPVLGVDIKVMDEEGRELPHGEVGELCIFGDGVSDGYIGNRDMENKAFVDTAKGRMYKSGDLGYYLPDGNIAFLHRKDTQIMIKGKRVEVSEVENVLTKSELIKQAYVAPKVDDNNLSYMVAYVVPEKENVKLADITDYMKDYLTDFMIPEYFVELKRLPLNANGKVDKMALPNVLRKVAA